MTASAPPSDYKTHESAGRKVRTEKVAPLFGEESQDAALSATKTLPAPKTGSSSRENRAGPSRPLASPSSSSPSPGAASTPAALQQTPPGVPGRMEDPLQRSVSGGDESGAPKRVVRVVVPAGSPGEGSLGANFRTSVSLGDAVPGRDTRRDPTQATPIGLRQPPLPPSTPSPESLQQAHVPRPPPEAPPA